MKKIQFPEGFVELKNKVVALMRGDEWFGIGGDVCIKSNGTFAFWINRGWDSWPVLCREIKFTCAAKFLRRIKDRCDLRFNGKSNDQIFEILTEGMECAWSKLSDREWEEKNK